MKLEESVALVVGAEGTVGEAIVRGLLARGAVNVYVVSSDPNSQPWLPGAVEIVVNPAESGYAKQLARQLADVTLLVYCTVATESVASLHTASEPQPLGQRKAADQALDLMEAFAPVLAANGGGAAVSVVSVLCADRHFWVDAPPEPSAATVDWMLADSLRDRFAAQQTQLLYYRAQLALGSGEQLLDDQRALAEHVAACVLARLEARAWLHDPNGMRHAQPNYPRSFQSGLETNE